MLNLTDVSLQRGTRFLLQDVNLTIQSRQKVGVIGVNGCGKSSFFALIMGLIATDKGEFTLPKNIRIAHLAQEIPALTQSALDYVLEGDKELVQLNQQLLLAEQTENYDRMAHLHEQMAQIDAYSAPARAAQLLYGLGFSHRVYNHSVGEFSGGWRMRLNLAQTLMCRSDLLLLDEPTNHLDLDALLWLEQWLRNYDGTILLISHDREFLDSVVTHIAHVDQRQIKLYTGNYSAFETQRAAHLALQQASFIKQQQQRAHLQHYIDRFRAQATKARQAQSRIKALARLEVTAAVQATSPFSFHFRSCGDVPNPLLHLRHANLGYLKSSPRTDDDSNPLNTLDHLDENLQNANVQNVAEKNDKSSKNSKNDTALASIQSNVSVENTKDKLQTSQANEEIRTILKTVNIHIGAGSRIGLLGPNGAGKSTLVKVLAGQLELLSGELSTHKAIRIGYFAQHQYDYLHMDDSPLLHLKRIDERATELELRTFLGGFGFAGDAALSPITNFSGGEKARLALALLVWQKPNLLLLDEPTNHLDLEMREALLLALQEYEGALVVVSHDRHLIRMTTDQLILVADGKAEEFTGDLNDYQEWLLSYRRAAAAKDRESAAHDRENAAASANKSAQNKNVDISKSYQAQRDAIQTKLTKLDAQLKKVSKELNDQHEILADAKWYEPDQKAALDKHITKQAELQKQAQAIEAEWMVLCHELEALEK